MSKKIGFLTLGCKVNIYESNALKNELIKKGYIVTDPDKDCDAYIVNTCSVTNMADAKSRKMISRLKKLNPNAIMCVMGCFSQTNPKALSIDGVDILVGNGNKLEIISLLEDKFLTNDIEKKIKIINILDQHEFENLEVTAYDHTRAFVKIEDGCENFCTYCIIPYARGPVRSKKADAVIAELKRITEAGYLEVVLAGIHTGRYLDGTTNLSGLIKRILKEVPKIERLRLSSIEINEIDDDFISLLKDSFILADHLHLPLQSGSDLILKKMERKYDLAYFKAKINKIRKVRPNIAISTDIIVGFPYETEKEFLETYEFSKEIGFSKIHVFPYSMRAGTKAAAMPQVNDLEKKERAKRLIGLSKELENNYANKFIGQEQWAIVEHAIDDKQMIGHTSNYLQVVMPLDSKLLKDNVLVKLNSIEGERVHAEIVKA